MCARFIGEWRSHSAKCWRLAWRLASAHVRVARESQARISRHVRLAVWRLLPSVRVISNLVSRYKRARQRSAYNPRERNVGDFAAVTEECYYRPALRRCNRGDPRSFMPKKS